MKYLVKLYPSVKGEAREQKIEADSFEETTHGNIAFKKDGDLVGVVCRGAFEIIKTEE